MNIKQTRKPYLMKFKVQTKDDLMLCSKLTGTPIRQLVEESVEKFLPEKMHTVLESEKRRSTSRFHLEQRVR